MLIKNSNEQKIKNNLNGKKNAINLLIQIPNISNTDKTVVVIHSNVFYTIIHMLHTFVWTGLYKHTQKEQTAI